MPRTRSKIIAFAGKARTYVITKMVLPLIEARKLNWTIPDKPKSSK
ncbi:MAG: hypothetical protein HFI40_04900 [Lachnospiraceae bacterium]|jgi:hypothetical protein|nr:hypothetical protein [Lachnospiraceae bacterium]MCX4316140.1 hypothetical protein [Lachnospiraceae bacterium]